MSEQLERFLESLNPPIKSIMVSARELILDALPGMVEQVDFG